MEKTELELTLEYTKEMPPLGRMILPKKPPKKPFPKKELAQGVFFCAAGLLWGRAELLGLLHPFGMAWLSAFFGEGILFWCVWAAVGAGFFPLSPLRAGAGLAAAAAIQLTMGRFLCREEMGKKALLGAFAAVLAGIFFAISREGLGFYFALAAVESSLTLGIGFFLQRSIALLLAGKSYPTLTREETLSFLLLAGGILAGLASLEGGIFRQVLLPAAAAFCLLFAARSEGIGGGAAAGVFFGFLLFLCGSGGVSLFAALSLGGMLAGSVRQLGRLASALAVVLAPCIFLFYIDATQLEVIWTGGLLGGAVLFTLFPRRLLEKWSCLRETETPMDRYTKMQERTEERLKGCAAAFAALADAFSHTEERRERREVTGLVDAVTGRVCQGCGLAHSCWEEEVYRTYSMTYTAFSKCEERGHLRKNDLPAYFLETCPRTDAFAERLNEVYELYRQDCIWGGRLAECKALVGQQMQAVGEIIEELSGQMDVDCIFLEGAENALTAALKKQGLRPKKVVVTEEKNGRGREAKILLSACGGKGVCKHTILPLVKRTLGCPMRLLEEGTCSVDASGRECCLTFREEPVFAMTTATAFARAEDCTGDAAAFLETEKGHVLLALSDGMGTGAAAAKESRLAIELLEQFTEAGFGRELAVRMINSALLLGREEDAYATLDICDIDLFDGQGEFIKLGAAASYIWRNGRMISLCSQTLPAGILQQVDAEKNEMRLKDGDLVILMTDGISDAVGGEERTADWLKGKLLAFPVRNPQDAADYLLQEAKKERRDGRQDDMTILVSRFWRKRI